MRYEQEFLENIRLYKLPTRTWWYRDVEVQDTGCLTSLSIDGEYSSITFSEPRGSILPASGSILMEGVLQKPYKGLSPLVFDLLPAMASTMS